MIDKIYYFLASVSLLLYCFKECYDYKTHKHKDYIKVNSIECDLNEVFDDYSSYDENLIKKDKYVVNMN